MLVRLQLHHAGPCHAQVMAFASKSPAPITRVDSDSLAYSKCAEVLELFAAAAELILHIWSSYLQPWSASHIAW